MMVGRTRFRRKSKELVKVSAGPSAFVWTDRDRSSINALFFARDVVVRSGSDGL